MTSVSGETWFSDPALMRVLALLNGDGGEARVAGGAVRNSLMGLPVADVDIATTLRPQAVVERAKAAGIKAVPTGIEHGTVTLVIDGVPFEVTTLRRDVATDGRHAEVAFGTDWQADAERRDLTINALYATQDGAVIDLVNGLPDIESRTVRFIGDAATRIAEDHLRILRFFRFFALYGSGRPDAEGLKACARAKESLARLSAERVWSETKKLLGAPDPGRALLWMRQAGVLTEILPETEKWGIDAIPGLIEAEKAFGWTPDALLRLAAMVPADRERLKRLAERLRLSKAEAAMLDYWASAPEIAPKLAETAFDRLLYRNGPQGLVMRLRLALAAARARGPGDPAALVCAGLCQRLLARAGKWRKPSFPLTGADVLAAGIPAGPKVGAALSAIEDAWVAGNFHESRAKLLARLEVLATEG
ncbi:CCA tRNA nucleotidyltransferase [Shinella zoogloeoides]|uniref:CCA tRNA nucleotidyltransferase n=1 Tax=Shinella zoogloeoides TaxID=352475 RepID=A0A6N8TJS2_SHIZO|nr:CCA tRNA nucleotidyltransferase [Shinella zoogloeoides]MXO01478.1 CCA tRNA nucleotidyltransferase [Shinella zoogloeoides]UEX80280.1 CCA tRNA nucleotidyltransferase [Shinella zoogloeoides]